MNSQKFLVFGFFVAIMCLAIVTGGALEMALAQTTGFPTAPSNLSFSLSGTNVTLTWNDNSTNETGFPIYRAASSTTAYVQIATAPANATASASYVDANVPAGTYNYTISSCISSNCSAGPTIFNVTVSGSPPPYPTMLTGPTTGGVSVPYYYSATLFPDLGGQQVQAVFDWGDGTAFTYSTFITPVTNGSSSPQVSHSWTTAGTYGVKVKAKNSSGAESGWTAVYNVSIAASGDTTPPSTPPAPTLSNITSSQIVLTWPASTDNVGVTGYKVYRYVGGSPTGTPVVFSVPTLNLTETSLSPATSYTYTIAAYDAAGNTSPQGQGATGTTFGSSSPTSVPNAPSGLIATVPTGSTAQINLSWIDNSGNEDGFKIYRKLSTEANWPSTYIATVGANLLAYFDTTVTTNTTYHYKVNAYNSLGLSGDSNVVTITAGTATTTTGVPPAPTNLRLDPAPTTNAVYLMWNDVVNEDKYNLDRSPAGANVWTTFPQLGANVTSYTDTTVAAGTVYDYRIQACLSGYGCSGYLMLNGVYTISAVTPPPPTTTNAPPTVTAWGVGVDTSGLATIGTAFNVEMDTSSFNDTNFFIQKVSDPADVTSHIAVSFRKEAYNVILTTANPLIAGFEYVSIVKGQVKSKGGVFMGNDYVCRFTAPAPRNFLASCPGVTSVVPLPTPVPTPLPQPITTTANTFLAGTVTDSNGAPLTYVGVHVFAKDFALNFGAPTAPDGTFKIGLLAGNYLVEAFPPFSRPDLIKAEPIPFSIAVGETKTLNIKFGSTAQFNNTIVGTVLFSNGSPVTDARVGAYNKDTYQWVDTVTDAAGKYALKVGGGSFTVNAGPVNFVSALWRGPLGFQEVEFTSSPALETKVVNFTVPLSQSQISVATTDQSGKALANAEVVLTSFSYLNPFETGAKIPPQYKRTDSNGLVIFYVAPGNYYAKAFLPPDSGYLNAGEQLVVAREGQTGVNLIFIKRDATVATNLSGTVKFEDGTPVSQATVWGWSEKNGYGKTQADDKGQFTISVAIGSRWHLGAAQEVGNLPFRSSEVIIDVTAANSPVTIIVTRLKIELPPPFAVTQSVLQPVVAQSSDGAKVVMPESATSLAGNVNVNWTPTVEAPSQQGSRVVGTAYDLTIKDQSGNSVSKLEKEVQITLPYNKDDLNKQGVSEDDLQPSYFDESTGAWIKVDNYTIDKENHVVVMKVNHLTRFALVAPADVTPPSSPTSLSSKLTGVTEVTLSWANPKADFHHAKVYRSDASAGIGSLIDDLVTTEAYKDATVAVGKTYYYSLKSVDAAGNESAVSKVLKVAVTGKVSPSAKPNLGKFVRSLAKGSRGKEIRDLQDLLIRLGFLPKDHAATEFFGPLTEKAIKDFQKSKGFEQTGGLGPKTRAELNKAAQ